ncbi:MAG: hypothetical protein ACXWUN_05385 [Allosphingosinicella sp.]
MRIFLGILAGIVVALVVQSAVDLVANLIYPAAITDMWDRRQVSEAMAARPIGALLFNIFAYFLGGFAGGYVARLIARTGWATWLPAGFLALMALFIGFNFPLPTWTLFATFAAPLIGGLLARHLGSDAPSAATDRTDAAI